MTRGRGGGMEQGTRESGGLRPRASACTRAIHPMRAWHGVTQCAGACAQACLCMHACTRARKARCKGTCMMHQPLLYSPPRRPPVSSAPCAAQPATQVTSFAARQASGARRPGAVRQGPHQWTNGVLHTAPARQRACTRGVFPMPRHRCQHLSRVDALTVVARTRPKESGGLIAPRAGECVAATPSDRLCPEPREPTLSRSPAPRRATAYATWCTSS